jgi:hypothetical protein
VDTTTRGTTTPTTSPQPQASRQWYSVCGCSIEVLRELDVETHLVISRLATHSYRPEDQAAAISSESFRTDGMVVVPYSMKALAAIHIGLSDELVARAADVTLKNGAVWFLVARARLPLGDGSHAGALVTEVLDGHVALDVQRLGRIHLNASVPTLQTSRRRLRRIRRGCQSTSTPRAALGPQRTLDALSWSCHRTPTRLVRLNQVKRPETA